MNATFEASDFLKNEIEASKVPWHPVDILTRIDIGQFARFDAIDMEILNGAVTITLRYEGQALGTFTFKRNLQDAYKIDGLFAHVKVGE